MTPNDRARELGVCFEPQPAGYLNMCVRTGNLLITSGHVSDMKGVLGGGLTVEQGYAAAQECCRKILRSVFNAHGTLNDLKVLKVLGCVYSAPTFTEQHLVINGCSDMLHQIFGKEGAGFHARSALVESTPGAGRAGALCRADRWRGAVQTVGICNAGS
ncbi:MAG: RidA family protein, partial [Planctomyces sp.]